MLTRKQLFAEKRKQKAKELNAFNRDQFIRKLLKRRGINVCFQNPDDECFRGCSVYVDQVVSINNCNVGVILGCSNCKHANSSFGQISLGKTKDLNFKCRTGDYKPKIWIMRPDETISKPGVYTVERTKLLYDAHGHLLEPRVRLVGSEVGPPLPRIRPRPAADTPFIEEPQEYEIIENLVIPPAVPSEWLARPNDHLAELLAHYLANISDEQLKNQLINAYTNGNLRIQVYPGVGSYSLVIEE